MKSLEEKINEAQISLAHLKEKIVLECIQDLIRKDILVFYEQTPYIDGRLLSDNTITVKSGCLLTTSNRINSLQIRYNIQATKITELEERLKEAEKSIQNYESAFKIYSKHGGLVHYENCNFLDDEENHCDCGIFEDDININAHIQLARQYREQ